MPVWNERKNDFRKKFDKLAHAKGCLAAKLDKQDITQQQINDIQTYARQPVESVDIASGDFKVKRRIIEMVDVEAAQCVDDDGQKHVQASCVLDGAEVPIKSMSKNGEKTRLEWYQLLFEFN